MKLSNVLVRLVQVRCALENWFQLENEKKYIKCNLKGQGLEKV